MLANHPHNNSLSCTQDSRWLLIQACTVQLHPPHDNNGNNEPLNSNTALPNVTYFLPCILWSPKVLRKLLKSLNSLLA